MAGFKIFKVMVAFLALATLISGDALSGKPKASKAPAKADAPTTDTAEPGAMEGAPTATPDAATPNAPGQRTRKLRRRFSKALGEHSPKTSPNNYPKNDEEDIPSGLAVQISLYLRKKISGDSLVFYDYPDESESDSAKGWEAFGQELVKRGMKKVGDS
ncbi:uncharacterized protein BXIN_2454 [Babesia sp. Xinjiang]|uniref:uncharacterized protein n=1 Tax=Babesia sp. Xinjiang TaxID=462227 RepID=UPI000A215B44|nr:uncharacterized protein BXIN_2454 [Babesia sp. Xinjiang]ORM41442.1 hypothetical protein BXIN_2454 [Babesia sp. Xinjiang]